MSDHHSPPESRRDHERDAETLESPIPQQNPTTSSSSLAVADLHQIEEWENKARSWLSTLSKRRNVSMNEIEAWIVSNQVPLPEQLTSLPRPQLYQRIASIHKLMRRSNQVKEGNSSGTSHARFQRTDQWLPVYSWLESLDKIEVVKSKEISDWLSENPTVNETLYSRHSRYHLMHYIQKCHMKILKRRGVLQQANSPVGKARFHSQGVKPISIKAAANVLNQPPLQTSSTTPSMKALSTELLQSSKTTSQPMSTNMAVMPPSTAISSVKVLSNRRMQSSTSKIEPVILNNGVATLALPCNISSKLKSSDRTAIKQDDALCKYELFTDLETQLTSLLFRHKP